MDIKGERMIEGNFEAEGKLVQHLKDVELMLEVGHAAGGLGDHDNSSIIEVLRSLIAAPR